jgi:hypothetical protein
MVACKSCPTSLCFSREKIITEETLKMQINNSKVNANTLIKEKHCIPPSQQKLPLVADQKRHILSMLGHGRLQI